MSVDPNRIAGIAYIAVDGVNQMLVGEFTYNLSKVTRETMIGQDAVHGYAERPFAGFIACKLRDNQSLDAASFNGMKNVTVTAQLANGKTIVGRNMWTVETQEIDTSDAAITVRWESRTVEEVLP